MLALKKHLDDLQISQVSFGASLQLSPAAINLLLNHNKWPKRREKSALIDEAVQRLKDIGASDEQIKTAFNWKGGKSHPLDSTQIDDKEYHDMLLRKQALFPETRKAFGLFRDPFADDVREQDDVFLTPDVRYVREALYQTARLGGFIAVVGESGSGKSTLRKDLITRLKNERQPVTVIEPFVLGMEDNDQKGKTLKSTQIAEAVTQAIDPLVKVKRSVEAKFRQMHNLLLESHQAGNKHCIIIEEAHSLPIPTLKHLKRFHELESGFEKLVSVILIGQPELRLKLSERNATVREVVQRCELVTLEPLDNHIRDYLAFKFDRVGSDISKIFDKSAFDAMQMRLTATSKQRDRHSLVYPLAINNLVVAAMNLTTHLGESVVTGDVITEAH